MGSVPSPPVYNICRLPSLSHKTFFQPPAHAYRAPHQISWDLGKTTKSQLLLIILSDQWKAVPTWFILSALIHLCQGSTIRMFFACMVEAVIHNLYLWQCFLALPQKKKNNNNLHFLHHRIKSLQHNLLGFNIQLFLRNAAFPKR